MQEKGKEINSKRRTALILKIFKHPRRPSLMKKQFTKSEAKKIGEKLGINWKDYNLEQFRMGMDVELEHGRTNKKTNVTNDNPLLTGKIALAHLNEFPDYYTRLERLEKQADIRWKGKKRFNVVK